MKTKIAYILNLALLLLLPFGCSDNQNQIVPFVNVGFNIDLNLPQFVSLSSTNNAIIYAGVGYNHNGVIVYRYSPDEFFAMDATCTQHIDVPTAVRLDDNGSAGTATCPKCQTKYYLMNNGYPAKGYPLKSYNVIRSGNSLYISN